MKTTDGSDSRHAPDPRTGWRAILLGGLLAALLFAAVWVPTHRPRPILATSDLYTHLSVARHIARGEGFRTDIAYPLSFAFPFARELPQPLIHRQPGFGLLLTIPYLLSDGDPAETVAAARRFQWSSLALLAGVGAAMLWRLGRWPAVGPWMVLLAANPMLAYAVDWGFDELACSMLLFVLWLRARGSGPERGVVDGLLVGALVLVRLELFWVPLVWWSIRRRKRRFWLPAVCTALIVMTPWLIRNARVSGQPFFALQSHAEHVKMTAAWPDYSVYRQLEPQPLLRSLTEDPLPLLRKIARGFRFFAFQLGGLLPWPVLALWPAAGLVWLIRRRRRLSEPAVEMVTPFATGPIALAGVTLALAIAQYSLFDHNLRHLLVLLPILLWESAILLVALVGLVPRRSNTARRLLPTWIITTALAGLAVLLIGSEPAGWQNTIRDARRQEAQVAERVAAILASGEEPLFVLSSAEPWYSDQPAVWMPQDGATRRKIRKYLGRTGSGVNGRERP